MKRTLSLTPKVKIMKDEIIQPFFEVRTVARAYAPYQWNHEPNVATLPNDNLLAVWGTEYGEEKMVGAFSTDNGLNWSEPVVLHDAKGQGFENPSLLVSGEKVFLVLAKSENDGGKLMYKVSTDNGETFSDATPFETGHKYTGAPNNGIVMRDGDLIYPFWWRKGEASSGVEVTSVMRSTDNGETWVKGGDVPFASEFDEVAIIELTNGDLYAIGRTHLGAHYQSWSKDKGNSWSEPTPTPLATLSHGNPCMLYRLSFEPNKVVVAWDNAPPERRFPRRYPLDVAISYDDCKTWAHSRTISNPGTQVSYPGITISKDGLIIVVYQQWYETLFSDVSDIRTDIKCARFNEEWIKVGSFLSPRLP